MVNVPATALAGAQQQIQLQQQQVAAQQASLARAKQQASLIRARMQPTAQQVRFGVYSGLAGMQRRQQLERTIALTERRAKESLIEPTKQVEANVELVSQNVEAVKKYEQQLKEYEKALAEQKVADSQEVQQPSFTEQQDYEAGYRKGIDGKTMINLKEKGAAFVRGYIEGRAAHEAGVSRKEAIPIIRKQAKEIGAEVKSGRFFYEGKPISVSKIQEIKAVSELAPGEVPVFKGGKLVGVESAALGKTFSLEGYNKAIQQVNIKEAPGSIDVRTGKPFGEVRPLTKEESTFYGIEKSRGYQAFVKATEPIRIVAGAFGTAAATITGTVLKPFFEWGRKPEDTSTTAKVRRGFLMGGKVAVLSATPITAIPMATYFGGSAVAQIAESPLGFVQSAYTYSGIRFGKEFPFIKITTKGSAEPFEFIGGIVGAKGGAKVSELSFFGKKPYPVEPTIEMESSVKPFSRQRATLLLKTEEGKYVFGKTKGGEIISIGGGIEKGQTPRQATLSELKQETGLTSKEISGFKKIGTIVTPEETFYTYVATISRENLAKIKPMSDIKKIVTISPRNIFTRGVTGQTPLQPVSRIVPFKGRLRAYEAGLITYAETGKKPTWLAIDTPQGQYFLGTQSRYDVPYSSQRKYLGKKELLLASGTPAPPVLKRTILPGQASAEIIAKKTKRGQKSGLYLQPPISAKNKQSGYIGLSYLGFKTSQESIGIRIGFPMRTALLFREEVKSPIVPTPKTFSGIESELIILPKTEISTTRKATIASIGLKKVYLQPTKIVKAGEGTKTFEEASKDYSSYKTVTPSEIASTLSLFQAPPSSLSYSKSKQEYREEIFRPIKSETLSLKEEKPSQISKSKTAGEVSLSISPTAISSSMPSYAPSKSVSISPSISKSPSLIRETISRSPYPYSPYPRPPSPVPVYTSKSPSKIKSLISKLGKRKGYELQIKRFGKYRKVAGGLSLSRAKLMGVKKTTATLGQTFRIIPKGETMQEEISFEVPSKIFTRLKRPTAQLEWVERRGMTLKKGTGEVPEILKAKRAKGGRRKIKWL